MNICDPTPLFAWINERHAIYLRRKEGQPWPWTTDPILQRYRFCQVFRELDTVTQWVRVNIREPYAQHPALWHMLLTARFINLPDTLQEIINEKAWYPGGIFDRKKMVTVMKRRAERGEAVWTNAYTVSTNGRKQNKADYITEHVLLGAWKKRKALEPAARTSLEEFCELIQEVDGIGGFMSYEVATDLRHCRGWLDKAPDIMTWANAGPGAKRGLNRLHKRPLKKGVPDAQAVAEMQHLLALAPLYLSSYIPELEMRDIEHSLCEHDKYQRVLLGEGEPRNLYHPLQGA